MAPLTLEEQTFLDDPLAIEACLSCGVELHELHTQTLSLSSHGHDIASMAEHAEQLARAAARTRRVGAGRWVYIDVYVTPSLRNGLVCKPGLWSAKWHGSRPVCKSDSLTPSAHGAKWGSRGVNLRSRAA